MHPGTSGTTETNGKCEVAEGGVFLIQVIGPRNMIGQNATFASELFFAVGFLIPVIDSFIHQLGSRTYKYNVLEGDVDAFRDWIT